MDSTRTDLDLTAMGLRASMSRRTALRGLGGSLAAVALVANAAHPAGLAAQDATPAAGDHR